MYNPDEATPNQELLTQLGEDATKDLGLPPVDPGGPTPLLTLRKNQATIEVVYQSDEE